MSKDELDFDPSIPEDERRFYLKAYPNVNHVRERKVHCTICKMHIGTAPSNESIIRMHPILRVTHCKKCHEFYNSGEFSKGEDGSELYCRWCGQGGEVYCCSNCPYVFCKSCIISNLSRGVVADIEQNENWSCFNCAPKMLWPLRAQHWALIKFIDKQKKAILSSNLTDSEIKIQMTKDRSLCCKIKKVGGGYGTDSSDSSDISLSRLKKKAGDKRSRKSLSKEDLTGGASPAQAKKLKNNDNDVVCTPDVLSMLEPECTLTVPAKSPANAQPSTPTPKIMSIQAAPPKRPTPTPPLILRNVQQPLLRPAPPTQVLKKTVVGPRMPAGGQSSDFTTPVYHTINGYRIDLNSAAQQETVRLPNGKLIQVKRQGTGPQQVTTVQNAPNQHSTPTRVIHNIATPSVSPITSGPSQQVVHSSGGHIIRAQLQAPRPVVMPTMQNNSLGSQYQQQLQQQQQQQQPTQPHYQQITIRQPQIATIRYQGNTAPQMSNMIPNGTMQILNGTQVTTTGSGQQLPSIRPVPTFIKQLFPNTPLGQSRTQLQNQIFNAMEICQHLMGKLQTLTNSNAYKTAKSMTDVKELYIHLSYLLTYAIGRFKGLQDNCLADMRDLGFTNDANSLENGQLAAGMDMVRNGMITDFSQVDLESFHSLIVQNMNLMKTAVAADSSTNSEVAETPGVSSKKLTHLNHNRMILAQNGNPVRTELDATSEANDDDPECLLVALDNEQSPEQIILESEDEEEPEEDCLLVELADRISDKYTPPASPTVEEKFNEQEEEKVLHSGLLTQYGIGDDEEYESDTKNDYRLLSVNFTKEQDLRLIKILKDFPLLWYPKKTNTKQPVMNVLWKKVNRLMPKKQASDAEEDEITIVEPKTDTINLDSDNEDDLPSPPPKKPNGNGPMQSAVRNNNSHIASQQPANQVNQSNMSMAEQHVTPTTTTNEDDEITAEYDFSKVASLLAGMLEVELTEGGTECVQQPKKPRKKTTHKPNPTLVKQKEMQERERLENIKKNCIKLKMEVEIPLNRVEEIYQYAKPMLEELKLEKLKAEEMEVSKKENEMKKKELEELGDEKIEGESTKANDITPETCSEKENETDDKDESEEVVVVLVEESDNPKEDEEAEKATPTEADKGEGDVSVELIDQDETPESDRDAVEEEEDSVHPVESAKVDEKSKEEEEDVDKSKEDEEVNEIEDEEKEKEKEEEKDEEMDEDKEEDESVEKEEDEEKEEDKEKEDEEIIENEDEDKTKEDEEENENEDEVIHMKEPQLFADDIDDEELELSINNELNKSSELPLNTTEADPMDIDIDPPKIDDSDKDMMEVLQVSQNEDDKEVDEKNLDTSSLSHNYKEILGRTEVV